MESKNVRPMSPRDLESELLDRCVSVGMLQTGSVVDQREANVFRVAAALVQHSFPVASRVLLAASGAYFAEHPGEEMGSEDVVRMGWIATLPRLRDMLSQRLNERGAQ